MTKETEIQITTADGKPGGFLYAAEGEGPRPGVLFLTDIFGIRQAPRDIARRLADQGYTVLMPNVFYRTGEPPMFDFKPSFGEERTMKRLGEIAGPLTPDAVERDAGAYVDFLAAQDATGEGPMGAVGFCFSGALAMRIAAARRDRIAAAASFHGGRLYTDDDKSPHLVLPRIKARLYFGHATEDRSMPAEAIEKLDRALEAWGGTYESEVYEGAHHGWTVPDSPSHHHEQAERAFQKLTELFAATLR